MPSADGRYQMCLSSTNETTPGAALSSYITGSYVPEAPRWLSVPIRGYTVSRIGLASIVLGGLGGAGMVENLDALNAAVSLLVRAVLLAARLSGRFRRRSLQRLAALDRLRFRAVEHVETTGTPPLGPTRTCHPPGQRLWPIWPLHAGPFCP